MLARAMEDHTLARAAERVHALAQSLVRGVAAARREATALERVLAGPALDGAAGADLDVARLVAIELADAGSSRGEVAHHLRLAYGGLAPVRLDGVLADVFG
jgi:hypothetical protein